MTDKPLTREERRRALEFVARRQKFARWHYFKPYPKQEAFFAMGADKRERLFMAGTQCVSPWTFIETVARSVLAVEALCGEAGNVLAWDGGSECVAQARSGFLAGIEPAYRFVLASGRFFDCSANHQVATELGWVSLARLMSLANGLHCWKKSEDYQASCVADGYLCDPQLPRQAGIDQGMLRVPAGVPNSSLTFSPADAAERIRRCTSPSRQSDHLTIADDARRRVELYARFAGPFSLSPVLLLKDCTATFVRSEIALNSDLSILGQWPGPPLERDPTSPESSKYRGAADRLARNALSGRDYRRFLAASDLGCSLPELHRDARSTGIFYPFGHPGLIGGERIIACLPIGYQPLIDCQVPGPNNYKAAGVFQHNCGKTEAGAYEATCHLTGLYPPSWNGKRFDHPIRMWAAGITSLDVRNVIQRKLCGPPGVDADWGTGLIPKDMLVDKSLARGITDAYDQVQVRHKSGGISVLQFKSYEQGRAKFQGDTIHVGWADEEPEKMEVYDEFLSRLTGDGLLYTTFTPLFGPTDLVNSFTEQEHPDRGIVRMELAEAEHFTAEEKERRLAGYKLHERDARAKGIPKLGSGAIFLTPEEMIVEKAIEYVPIHWGKIWGIDFGIGHPFGAVLLLWDRDADVVHVHHTIRMADALSIVHAQRIRLVAGHVPVAWPHDGTHRDRNSGETLASAYKKHGLRMLGTHAQWPDGSMSTEAAIHELDEREKTGRLRVAAHLNDWLEERRFYHRKDGQIVKLRDDLMAATQKGLMMLRYARSSPMGEGDVSRETSVMAKNVDFDVFAPFG